MTSAGRKCLSRHRKIWIIAGGYWLWCYECGAIKLNVPVDHPDYVRRWYVPVGANGENPAMQKGFK
jgi:hypothetical protein